MEEKIIPIKWSAWDDFDINEMLLYGVEFIEDFGIFKKGETYSSAFLSFVKGKLEVYDEKGTKIIKSQNFKCTPIN